MSSNSFELPHPELPKVGSILTLVRRLDFLSQILDEFSNDKYCGTIQEICGLVSQVPHNPAEFRESLVAEKLSRLICALHNGVRSETSQSACPWNVMVEKLVVLTSNEIALLSAYD